MNYSRSLIVVFVIFCSIIPAAGETVNIVGIMPSASAEMAKQVRLLVRPFSGSAGFIFSRAVQTALNKPDVQNVPYFTVLVGGLNRASRIDAIADGLATASSTDQAVDQVQTQCTQYRGLKCVASVNQTIHCTLRTVSASFDLRIARPGSNEILYSTTKPLQDQGSWCSGQGLTKTVDQTIGELASQAAEQIRLEISPHSESYAVRVMETTDGLSTVNLETHPWLNKAMI